VVSESAPLSSTPITLLFPLSFANKRFIMKLSPLALLLLGTRVLGAPSKAPTVNDTCNSGLVVETTDDVSAVVEGVSAASTEDSTDSLDTSDDVSAVIGGVTTASTDDSTDSVDIVAEISNGFPSVNISFPTNETSSTVQAAGSYKSVLYFTNWYGTTLSAVL
jgi:hypothetical protein